MCVTDVSGVKFWCNEPKYKCMFTCVWGTVKSYLK